MPANPAGRPRWAVASAIGICQILVWGSTYYLPAVLAVPVAQSTGWPTAWILGGLSLGLLVSGLVSPPVGRAIDNLGGRPVLAISAVLAAAGLAILAAAPSLAVYVAAWLVIGLGMGTGLYDPAFATLGRLYGESARSLITGTTLFGGFASTVCWPLTAVLVAHTGWRGACLIYAAINLAIVLPLYLLALPKEPRRTPPPRTAAQAEPAPGALVSPSGLLFWLVAINLTLASMVMTVIAAELITLLHARGIELATAVALGALIGPSQVGSRALEFLFARRVHPVWSMLTSTLLVAAGLLLLMQDVAFAGVGLVLYGSGSGIRSIVRGTLPLVLFGREGYATVIGRLAFPSLVAQAASPSIGALLLDHFGAKGTILALVAAALLNSVAVLVMAAVIPRRTKTA
jgi:predicted MFS family arabinose efflux permease